MIKRCLVDSVKKAINFDKHQYGFQKATSTQSATTVLLVYTFVKLENKYHVVTIPIEDITYLIPSHSIIYLLLLQSGFSGRKNSSLFTLDIVLTTKYTFLCSKRAYILRENFKCVSIGKNCLPILLLKLLVVLLRRTVYVIA